MYIIPVVVKLKVREGLMNLLPATQSVPSMHDSIRIFPSPNIDLLQSVVSPLPSPQYMLAFTLAFCPDSQATSRGTDVKLHSIVHRNSL